VVIPTWLGGCLLAVAAAAPFEGDRIALLAMVAPMSWCLFARRDRAAVARISWPILLFLLWLALTMLLWVRVPWSGGVWGVGVAP